MSFLNAEWRKLALANYAIDPKILAPYVPNGTKLDLWEGQCFVSLVGFMFVNTRLLGFPIPFHRHFEEVNLRFYVVYEEDGKPKRGVVFIKEIVPKPLLTLVANTIYKEHYQTMKMGHLWAENEDLLQVQYEWQQGKRTHHFALEADPIAQTIEKGSDTEFITEHYWGYTKINEQTTFEYEVTHPSWKAYAVRSAHIDVDFGELYGSAFGILSQAVPHSIMLAEGSEITVENKRKLKLD